MANRSSLTKPNVDVTYWIPHSWKASRCILLDDHFISSMRHVTVFPWTRKLSGTGNRDYSMALQYRYQNLKLVNYMMRSFIGSIPYNEFYNLLSKMTPTPSTLRGYFIRAAPSLRGAV